MTKVLPISLKRKANSSGSIPMAGTAMKRVSIFENERIAVFPRIAAAAE